MGYERLNQREIVGYWHTIVGTLEQRGLLKQRPQRGGFVKPEAVAILAGDRICFALDMQRLAGIAREKWLDEDLWRQWRAALSGRRVVVVDGWGLVVVVARTPGLPSAKHLPATIPLTTECIPDEPYTVCLGRSKRGAVMLDLAGAHRAILTGGTSGSGKSTMMKSVILQLAQKHTQTEFQVAICDLKTVDFRDPFDRLPHLFAPIAYNLDAARQLIERIEQERQRRAAVMAQAGVADWRRLGEPFPLLLAVIDEAADFSKHAAMDTLVEIARKGRAMGVSVLLGTQLPSARVINPQVRANLSTAIAFQCRTHIESQAILGTGGAEKLDRPGLALTFVDGRWRTVQTLQVDTDGDGGDLAERVSVPVVPALAALEMELVQYALEDLGGAFIIGRLAGQFAGQISKYKLTQLGQKWELRGLLTEPARDGNGHKQGRMVTAELATLADRAYPMDIAAGNVTS